MLEAETGMVHHEKIEGNVVIFELLFGIWIHVCDCLKDCPGELKMLNINAFGMSAQPPCDLCAYPGVNNPPDLTHTLHISSDAHCPGHYAGN